MPELEWDPYSRQCPTRAMLDRIGDRWTVLVVGALSSGPLRFGQLASRIDGVSQKMLTQTLRGLERDGLVSRTIFPQIPPRVEYELTDAGLTLQEPLRALEKWATAHMADVLASRDVYDAAIGAAAPSTRTAAGA
jgi:DNA-binding HxlR family transcriptional regulator